MTHSENQDICTESGSANVSKPWIAWFVMIFIGLSWGATIPLTKIAVSTGHSALGLIFWQQIIGILLLGTILLARRRRLVLSPRYLTLIAVVAFSGTIFPNSASYVAQAQLPAGVMAIVIATVPMFTLLLALALRIEPPSLLRFLGILIGFVAMVLLAIPEGSLPNPSKAVYVLVALIGPVFYAIESIYVKWANELLKV